MSSDTVILESLIDRNLLEFSTSNIVVNMDVNHDFRRVSGSNADISRKPSIASTDDDAETISSSGSVLVERIRCASTSSSSTSLSVQSLTPEYESENSNSDVSSPVAGVGSDAFSSNSLQTALSSNTRISRHLSNLSSDSGDDIIDHVVVPTFVYYMQRAGLLDSNDDINAIANSFRLAAANPQTSQDMISLHDTLLARASASSLIITAKSASGKPLKGAAKAKAHVKALNSLQNAVASGSLLQALMAGDSVPAISTLFESQSSFSTDSALPNPECAMVSTENIIPGKLSPEGSIGMNSVSQLGLAIGVTLSPALFCALLSTLLPRTNSDTEDMLSFSLHTLQAVGSIAESVSSNIISSQVINKVTHPVGSLNHSRIFSSSSKEIAHISSGQVTSHSSTSQVSVSSPSNSAPSVSRKRERDFSRETVEEVDSSIPGLFVSHTDFLDFFRPASVATQSYYSGSYNYLSLSGGFTLGNESFIGPVPLKSVKPLSNVLCAKLTVPSKSLKTIDSSMSYSDTSTLCSMTSDATGLPAPSFSSKHFNEAVARSSTLIILDGFSSHPATFPRGPTGQRRFILVANAPSTNSSLLYKQSLNYDLVEIDPMAYLNHSQSAFPLTPSRNSTASDSEDSALTDIWTSTSVFPPRFKAVGLAHVDSLSSCGSAVARVASQLGADASSIRAIAENVSFGAHDISSNIVSLCGSEFQFTSMHVI